MLARIDSFLSHLVSKICPNSTPGEIDHLIIKLYLHLVLLSALLLALYAFLIRRFLGSNSHQVLLWTEDQLTVDVCVDWDAYSPDHLPVHIVLEELRTAFETYLSNSQRRAKVVYWCYVDREDEKMAGIVAQLEMLEDRSDGSVLVIDTPRGKMSEDGTSKKVKSLLTDLFKVAALSVGQRFFVISTADVALCQYGLQLLSSHPCAPLLSYVVPPGCTSLPSKSCAADYVFCWEEDRLIISNEERTEVGLEPVGPVDQDDFRPLVLFLKAYGPVSSGLQLGTVLQGLKAWYYDLDRPEEEQTEEVWKHVDRAISEGVIRLCRQSASGELCYEDSTRVFLVGKHSPTEPASGSVGLTNKANNLMAEPSAALDEDGLTTTGSDSELESALKPSNSSILGVKSESASHQSLPSARETSGHDVRRTGNQMKHKHAAPEILAIERPVKKKKNALDLGRPDKGASLPSTFRVVSKTRKRSLKKISSAQVSSDVLSSEHTALLTTAAQVALLSTLKGPQSAAELSNYEAKDLTGRSAPLLIDLSNIQTARQSARSDEQIAKRYNSLPQSPVLWMYSCSGMIEGSPLSVGFGSLYRREAKRTMSARGSANERFASLFSPALINRSHATYPFPDTQAPDETDVD